MGAIQSKINPTCWAIKGIYKGVKYDGINVVPVPAQKKIVFTVTTDSGQVEMITEADFPPAEQTEHGFAEIMRRVVSAKLRVLL
jgi:hypothetical protein